MVEIDHHRAVELLKEAGNDIVLVVARSALKNDIPVVSSSVFLVLFVRHFYFLLVITE